MNELMNDGGICRTAPATPGLLKKYLTPSLKKKSLPYTRKFMKMTQAKVTFQECEYFKIQSIRQMIMFFKVKDLTDSYIRLKFQVQKMW